MRFIKVDGTIVCIAKLKSGLLKKIISGEKQYEVRTETLLGARLIAYTDLGGRLLGVWSIGEDLPYDRFEDQRVREMADIDAETFTHLFPPNIPRLWVARIHHKITDGNTIDHIKKQAHL
ncbi:MAG: hypothetical protein LKJ47_04905 [Bifidobacteriaceae bacterium]|jgi:predicted nucleic acid-binding protein|nr:hypothetical protein [Bifidobacteriaceae bacterium]